MAGGKSGNRKHGRNEKWCQAYKARHQREKNKVVKLRRHLVKHPADRTALVAMETASKLSRGMAA